MSCFFINPGSWSEGAGKCSPACDRHCVYTLHAGCRNKRVRENRTRCKCALISYWSRAWHNTTGISILRLRSQSRRVVCTCRGSSLSPSDGIQVCCRVSCKHGQFSDDYTQLDEYLIKNNVDEIMAHQLIRCLFAVSMDTHFHFQLHAASRPGKVNLMWIVDAVLLENLV